MTMKKFVAVTVFAFAFAFAAVASAAVDLGTTTLRRGSAGVYVSNMQSQLNVCTGSSLSTDGKFGPSTEMAVKAFQASKGLLADGLVGNATKSALNNCGSSSVSTTTTTTTTLPAGCFAGAMFSSITGQACVGGSSSMTSTTLNGSAGDLEDVDILSTYSGEEILEGATDEDGVIMSFELEADNGSDLLIQNVRLAFAHSGAGSDRLDDYVDAVKVWTGNEVVGESDVDEFSENSDVYSRSISLSNVVVEEGETTRFLVSVDALNNIDSNDLAENWEVNLESVRFADAGGAIITDSATGELNSFNTLNSLAGQGAVDFSFEDLTTSGDLEFKVTEGSNNPDEQAVEGSDNSDTNDVLMLEAELKAEGSDLTIDEIEFDLASVGADIDVIAKEFKLLVDGDEIDTVDSASFTSTSGQLQFTDLEDEFMIDSGDTVTIQVLVDINEIDGVNFVSGDSLSVSFNGSTNVDDTTNTVVEDENGDDVPAGDRTGSVTGEAQSFYADGIMVSLTSTDADITTEADPGTTGSAATGTFVIKFKVTAFGEDVFIDKDAVEDTSPFNTASQLSYSITNDGDVAATTASLQSTADEGTDGFEVKEGQTEEFTLTVAATATADTFTRVILESIGYKVGSDAAGDTQYTSNLSDDYKTGDLYLELI